MKNDINLLFRRKSKKYSGKRWASILIGIAFFAGGVYAGIALPSQSLAAANLNSKMLNDQVIQLNVAMTQQTAKMNEYQEKSLHLEDLKAIDSAKSDVSAYIQAVEDSLPTDANITLISISENTLGITGVAKSDAVIAMFCVKLRDTHTFDHVYVASSTIIPDDEMTMFSLSAQLPTYLGGFEKTQAEQDSVDQENAIDENTAENVEQTDATQEEIK